MADKIEMGGRGIVKRFVDVEGDESYFAEEVSLAGGGSGPSGGTVVEPSKGTLTDQSGTITSGGTAQTAAASDTDRVFLQIVCPIHAPEGIYYSLVGTAVVDDESSIELQPGDSATYDGTFVPSGAVSVIAATTGTPFTVWEA